MFVTTVTRCRCGRVSNPISLMRVQDAWIDRKGVAWFEFKCPQCKKDNKVKTIWIEKAKPHKHFIDSVTVN